MPILGFCLSSDVMSFLVNCIWDGFIELEPELKIQCLISIQKSLCIGIFTSIAILFFMRILCVILAQKTERHVCEELKASRKKIDSLTKKLARYQSFVSGISSVVKIYFSIVARRCNFSANERVSFYILEKRGKLSISDRNAINPDYQGVHRQSFSSKEGVISLARKQVSVLVDNLPDYSIDKTSYVKVCKKEFNLSEQTIKGLTMKARFYYAYRFSSPDQQKYNSIVVIESMRAVFMEKQALDHLFGMDNDFIYTLVDVFGPQLPRLRISREKEF